MRSAFIALSLALAAPVLASPVVVSAAFADETISLKGVNLGDVSTVAKLHQAVLKTAEAVCKKEGVTGRDLRVCVRDTTDNAIKGNPSQELKAYHASLSAEARYVLASN